MFIRPYQPVSECHIMKYEELERVEKAREARDPAAKSCLGFCLLSCFAAVLTLALPTNVLDRKANLPSSFPEWKTTSAAAACPGTAPSVQAPAGPGMQAETQE